MDQFYTKNYISEYCTEIFFEALPSLGYKKSDELRFIEPSAGTGSFLEWLPLDRTWAFDIEPKHPGIIKADFLKLESDKLKGLAIGNPPFGKKSKLALEFLNKCCEFTDTIGFILPVQFRKVNTQKKVNKKFSLILDEDLDPEAFIFEGASYSVRCCFQIWTTRKYDLRISRMPISHPDFIMYQYNNTKGALKFFEEDFDFAVPRQGYQDYSRRETNETNCEKNKQWILFKAKSPEIKQRLDNIDFYLLSLRNTSTPGFGKADVVEYYSRLYDRW